MIRRLARGELVPSTPPARYRTGDGYIVLRWRLAKRDYVEVLEHRVAAGRVVEAENVHHRNHVKNDNDPENLVPLSKVEHGHAHAVTDRQAVAAAYLSGLTTIEVARQFDTHPGNVSRMLAQMGVVIIRGPRGRKPADIDRAEALRLISAGEPISRIARRMGCPRWSVEAVRIAHGIPARPPGRP